MTNRDRILVVGLADGTLTGRRRERAERRLARIPGVAEQIERQRRVARALQGGPSTPSTLAAAPLPLPAPRRRMCPDAARRRRDHGRRHRPVLRAARGRALDADPGRRPRQAGCRGAGACGGRVRCCARSSTASAFPEWEAKFGWRATGERSDRLDGRRTRTVYYEHTSHRIAYTVVSGPPLELPEHTRRVRRDGLTIALYRDPSHGGHDVAIFERNGHTCVLAGHVMHTSTIVKLAAWRGDGAVRS